MTKACGHLGDTNTVNRTPEQTPQLVSSDELVCHQQRSELQRLRGHKTTGAHQHLEAHGATPKSLEAGWHSFPPLAPSSVFLPNGILPFINNFVKLYIQVQFSIYTRFTHVFGTILREFRPYICQNLTNLVSVQRSTASNTEQACQAHTRTTSFTPPPSSSTSGDHL